MGRGDCLYPSVVAEGGDLRASNPRALWRPLSVLIMIVALVAPAVLVAPVTRRTPRPTRAVTCPISSVSRARQVYDVMRRDALYFVTTGPGSSNGTWKEAVGQSPKPGTVVPWHFQATVRVSTANPHAARRVPRLIGLSRARTYAVMKHAQLFFTYARTREYERKVDRRPSPVARAGTRVRWHATISLVVSTRRPKKPVKKPVTTTTVKETQAGLHAGPDDDGAHHDDRGDHDDPRRDRRPPRPRRRRSRRRRSARCQ